MLLVPFRCVIDLMRCKAKAPARRMRSLRRVRSHLHVSNSFDHRVSAHFPAVGVTKFASPLCFSALLVSWLRPPPDILTRATHFSSISVSLKQQFLYSSHLARFFTNHLSSLVMYSAYMDTEKCTGQCRAPFVDRFTVTVMTSYTGMSSIISITRLD